MSDVKKVMVEVDGVEDVLVHDDTVEVNDNMDEEATDSSPDIVLEDHVEFSVDDAPVSVEDLDEDEEIWPGGPTAAMIINWKEQYGDVYVTSITYDSHIVWRVLNRLEYKNIVKKMETLIQDGAMSSAEANMWNEEAIAQTCVLYPQIDLGNLTGAMAGVPSLISQEVLEASGFVALEVRQL